jgi:hypothetical protein
MFSVHKMIEILDKIIQLTIQDWVQVRTGSYPDKVDVVVVAAVNFILFFCLFQSLISLSIGILNIVDRYCPDLDSNHNPQNEDCSSYSKKALAEDLLDRKELI